LNSFLKDSCLWVDILPFEKESRYPCWYLSSPSSGLKILA
jgi:hypothetical protein